MKLILNIYDYGVFTHVKFQQGVVGYRGIITFDCQNFNDFFLPQPKFVSNNGRTSDNLYEELLKKWPEKSS